MTPAEQDEYADRIDELLDRGFASDRRGEEVTDDEFAEAVRWLIEGPRLSSEELVAFLERNRRVHVHTDRANAEIIARAKASRKEQQPTVP